MPKVLIGGGSGLLGTRLSQMLSTKGYEVCHLSRNPDPESDYKTFGWDVKGQTLDLAALAGVDYLINLAGAGIADKPWTSQRKRVIIESRAGSNRLLADSLARTGHRPKAFLSSSAIGFYGDRGEEILTEGSSSGQGFLPESTRAWEESLAALADLGIPAYGVRLGVILSRRAKSLKNFLLPVWFFTSPYFGSGQQWMSWIHIDDACRLFMFLMETERESGFYNGTSPNPVRMKDLMKEVGRAWDRPTLSFSIPASVMRLFLGEMADILLDSTRVIPDKAEGKGFRFTFPDLGTALRDIRSRKV